MLDKYYHTKDVYYTREKMTAYLRGELEDYETRAFEKLMAEDPFLQEALEGIRLSGLASAEKHLERLDKKTDILTGVKKPVVFSPLLRNVSMAAMLLILMGASYFIINRMNDAASRQSAMEVTSPEDNNTTSPTTTPQDDSLVAEPGNNGSSAAAPVQEDLAENETLAPPVTPEESEPVPAAQREEVLSEIVMDDSNKYIELDVEDMVQDESSAVTYTYSPPATVTTTQKSTAAESDKGYLSGTPATDASVNETYAVVEEMPEFPGGEKAMMQYFAENLRYPAQAKDSRISGIVYIQFVITETGDIINSRVLKGIGSGCDEEALRVVNEMPLWSPGKQGGVKVKVLYTLPVKFSLD
ncbi:MAG: hypothetical protein ABR95_12650 [Sphingobacteriales bacterium BACL12 MAG-120813-bin55]|jgi:TonB family protein|nr:MAG: hypothetical protein ABR94_11130 [Sphingobacteriales bacterium BACL12 MAG-120802-bin5]KRP13923.1 MAG: hypothetical protein ABR95_12650 [Sphingobacteriales bacterium BACL12 MAG-120813-bin55]